MKRLPITLMALLTAVPGISFAQDIVLDEIVVTATRVETSRARTGVSVQVVTEAALKQAGVRSVAAILAGLPGVSVSSNGPFGSATNLRVRGADGRYLAVFIDGVRVSDPTGVQTSFDFGALMGGDLGRIEILRGSQSALWGGSAVGGVINITTRRATQEGTIQRVNIEGGAYGSAALSYGFTHKDGALETEFTLSHLRTDGFSAAAAGTEADGADATRLSFSGQYQVSDLLALGVSGFWQDTRQEYDGFDAAYVLTDLDNVQRRDEFGARLFAELSAGATDHMFEVTQYRIGREYDQSGVVNRFDGNRTTLGWQATTVANPALTLVYGADTMLEQAAYSNLPLSVADTRISGAFAQALWAPTDRLDIAATLRTDRISTFGSFQTGRLAVAWRPAEGTTLRAAVATGFRAPSIDERFGDYPGFFPFVGNPALTPEESTSFELGVEQAFAGGATLQATLFRLEIDNLVTYQFGAPSTLVNLPGRSVREGVELSGSLPLGDRVTLGLGYTYTEARRPNGARLGLVPRHDLSLTLDADVTDRLSAGLRVQHVAGRLDDFASFEMPDYTVVEARIGFDLGPETEAFLRVENLFDETYQQSNGYATAGRSVYVGLQKSF